MTPEGFEPTIPANELLQTHALDRAATGIKYNAITVNNELIKLHDGAVY